MLISYVLPVYNEQNNAAICVRSLLDQSLPGEIIVIDDCSTDNSLRILETFGDRLRLFKNPKRMGAAWCRNYGNSQANGDIIAVCDADHYYKDRGKAIHQFFEDFPEKGVFYSALHIRDAANKYAEGLQEAYKWDFNSKCPISHPTVAYRRELALKHHYHEDSVDTDLFEFMLLDMHKAGADFGGCQNPLLLKIEGNRNRNHDESKRIKTEKYLEYGIEV